LKAHPISRGFLGFVKNVGCKTRTWGCRKHPHYSKIGLGAFREFGSILREYNNEIKVAESQWEQSQCANWPQFPPSQNDDPLYMNHPYMLPSLFSRLPPLEYSLTHFSSTNPSSPRGEQNSPFLACHVANNSNFILLLLVSF